MRLTIHIQLLVAAMEAALLNDEETAAEWLWRLDPTLCGEELRQCLSLFRELRALGWRPPRTDAFRG